KHDPATTRPCCRHGSHLKTPQTSSRCAGRHDGGAGWHRLRWLLHSSAIQQPPRLVRREDPELLGHPPAAGPPSTCPSLRPCPRLLRPVRTHCSPHQGG